MVKVTPGYEDKKKLRNLGLRVSFRKEQYRFSFNVFLSNITKKGSIVWLRN